MKLVFWEAKCLNDSDCYSIRTKTKKECLFQISTSDWHKYEPPEKIILEYKDSFELLSVFAGEGGYRQLQVN